MKLALNTMEQSCSIAVCSRKSLDHIGNSLDLLEVEALCSIMARLVRGSVVPNPIQGSHAATLCVNFDAQAGVQSCFLAAESLGFWSLPCLELPPEFCSRTPRLEFIYAALVSESTEYSHVPTQPL